MQPGWTKTAYPVQIVAPRRFDYGEALQNELIEFIPQSQGLPIKTFRGLAVLLDDNLSPAAGIYTTIF
jgi:hypothetical protein